jgi:hypothetical protein
MAIKILPSFELAFRRTLFLFIIIFGYLLFGATVLRILPRPHLNKLSTDRQNRLDFERAELLNVLWAESIGRSEHDWALLANQKLDSYERSLREAGDVLQTDHLDSLPNSIHYCFCLITTIGGIDIDELSLEAKIFSIIYTTFGIPLVMLYLAQCAKAITAILPGNQTLLLAVSLLFITSIVHDIFEDGDDDTPFTNAVFGVFLTMSTIGVAEKSAEMPALLLYASAVVSLSAFSVAFLIVQRHIEKRIGGYEMAFSRQVGHIERVISGDRLDVLEEDESREDEEDSEYISTR